MSATSALPSLMSRPLTGSRKLSRTSSVRSRTKSSEATSSISGTTPPDSQVVEGSTGASKGGWADAKGESSLRGRLKAGVEEQGGSLQSSYPPEAKDDKALNMAFDLLRGSKTHAAFPPNPRSATLPN